MGQNQLALQPYSLWQVSACTINAMDNKVPYPNLHTGSLAPFLYTPTYLLPEHSILTGVQQATGRNGQQWITCRSGGEGTRPEIWMGSELVPSNSTANSATFGLGTQHPNGLYHCLTAQSQREYFSLYLRDSGKVHLPDVTLLSSFTPLGCKAHLHRACASLGYELYKQYMFAIDYTMFHPPATLPTPIVSGRHTAMWTLTSTHGIQVKRYIVEFECRVRNITFVEKYMSVSASGGTGQVATSVSCFGGLGQLYRVKVWAVSGPNISPAVNCTPDGKCSKEEGGRNLW